MLACLQASGPGGGGEHLSLTLSSPSQLQCKFQTELITVAASNIHFVIVTIFVFPLSGIFYISAVLGARLQGCGESAINYVRVRVADV